VVLGGIISGDVKPKFGGTKCGPAQYKPIAKAIPDEYYFPGAQKTISFADVCENHDECWKYACSRSSAHTCDLAFYNGIKEKCDSEFASVIYYKLKTRCYEIAKSYYDAVSAAKEAVKFPLKVNPNKDQCPK
jgi:hypothetical protein